MTSAGTSPHWVPVNSLIVMALMSVRVCRPSPAASFTATRSGKLEAAALTATGNRAVDTPLDHPASVSPARKAIALTMPGWCPPGR